jgi:ribonuclease HI
MSNNVFYAVKLGRTPGIYKTWSECELNVKGFKGAVFKKFNSKKEAQEFIDLKENSTKIEKKSISCDGSCLGNPGLGRYRIVNNLTGETLTSKEFPDVTNNLMEYLAIIESLRYIKKNNLSGFIIYSDSVTAISWIKDKKINSKSTCDRLLKYAIWLNKNYYGDLEFQESTPIIKWNTRQNGEISADFGNK